jgi:hypothetical protein
MMCLARHRDSSSRTRSQDHREDNMVTSGCTIDCLRDRKAIGIIGDPDFPSQGTPQVSFHRPSI